MSMPSIDLDCNKCEHSGSSMALWGRYSYTDGEHEINIHRDLGWCFGCERLTAVESLSITDYCKDMHGYISELSRLTKHSLLLLFSKYSRARIKLLQGKIKVTNDLIAQIAGGKREPRCLSCGSTHVDPFDGDYSLEYEGLNYDGEKKTGYIHKGCGGEFIAKPNPLRFNMKFPHLLYNLSGVFQESITD